MVSEGKRWWERSAGASAGSASQSVRRWWIFSCWQWGAKGVWHRWDLIVLLDLDKKNDNNVDY